MTPLPDAHPNSAPDARSVRTVVGACNLCEAICGLEFEVDSDPQGERITAIRGHAADPLSRGHICPKAVALKDLHEDPDRLRQPVKRVQRDGQTTWQTIGWDEAFDLVVEGLARTREQHGANAVAVYQGNPSIHNWGNVTHGHLFLSQLKTRHRYSATSVDQLPHHMAAMWLYGHQMRLPIPDIDRTGYFLVIGANPLASNGSLMTVPDVRRRLRALRQRGGRLVVIDPRRTETAAVADEHHFITPGCDAAWLLSLLHTLLDEQLTQPGRWQELLDDLPALQDTVRPYSPDATAAFTGIDAGTTRRIARELAASAAAACYGRMGVSTQTHGVICQWAIQVINLLTGNVDREGGTLLTHPAVDLIKMGLLSPGHHDAWRSRVRQAPEFGGELPVATMAEEMLNAGPGQVRALVTSCGNPVLSTPHGRQLDQALQGLDFMVSVDFFINETTRHAHVILPPTCSVEHDHYDLIFLLLAVRNVTRYSPPIVSKAAGTLDDWQIYSALARRYARRIWASEKAGIGQRLKGLVTRSLMARLSPSALLRIALHRSAYRVSFKQLLAHPEGIDLGPLRPGLIETLRAQRRRVGLLPAPIKTALPALWDEITAAGAEPATSTLKLIGRRDARSNNSWLHNSARLVSGKPRCVLWMHPEDAHARQLSQGQQVQVQSRVGRVTLPLHVTPDIKAGVVSLPHGWGHDREGTALRVAHAHAGVSINDLSDDQRTDPVSGNAAFSALPVDVSAA